MSRISGILGWVALGATFVAAPAGDAAAQANTGRITGQVLTSEGAPAPDAEIRVVTLSRVARVDERGVFAFESVPIGTYLLEVISPRSGQAIRRVTVRAGAEVEVAITLRGAIHLEQIVVTAGTPARRGETFQATTVIPKDELALWAENSLGETLSREPGVTSTYFGPGASRPVIRGLGGDRVRLLENGLDVGDASSTSPDHAVSIEPVAAERVEILRGPSTLLYGGSAIGGVVNVLDHRIPRERPTRPFSGEVQGLGGTTADELNGAASVTLGGGPVVLHLDGVRRRTHDYAIPGFADLEVEQGVEEPGDEEPGTLENSAVETTRGAVGLSLVGKAGFIGASFTGLDSEYGVPGGHAEEGGGEEEEEAVMIDLRQRRVDVEGGWRFANPFLHGVRARFGITDYEHRELEGEAVGTVFTNDLWEARLEADHGIGRLSGIVGAQFGRRDFSAIGEEAFVPPTQTDKWAMFAVEELGFDRVGVLLGARYEHQRAAESAGGLELGHTGVSASGGIRVAPRDELTLALTVSRSVKLPNAEELFSNGPHAATRSFEVGDPALNEERAWGVDASVRVSAGPVQGEVNGFVTRFDNFIYEAFTNQEQDGLPVFVFTQDDARFTGFEVEAEVELLHRGNHHVALDAWSDYVRAELTDADAPLPRIAPWRVGSGIQYEGGPFAARLGVRRVGEQNRVTEFEEPTPGYTMLDASASYRLFTRRVTHEITVRGTNLTNQDARNHVSFLKELAPLPGRDVRVMYRLVF